MTDIIGKHKTPTVTVSLVDVENFTIRIGGEAPTLDMAIAMLEAATRVFKHQWEMGMMAEMQQKAESQRLANMLMTKPQ